MSRESQQINTAATGRVRFKDLGQIKASEFSINTSSGKDIQNTNNSFNNLRDEFNLNPISRYDNSNAQSNRSKRAATAGQHRRQSSRGSSSMVYNNSSINLGDYKNLKCTYNRRRKKVRRSQQRNIMDASSIVKYANYYFDKNPTYLKETEVGEASNMNLKKYIDYSGAQRMPQFGFPHLNLESTNQVQGGSKSISKTLLGDTKSKSKKEKHVERMFFSSIVSEISLSKGRLSKYMDDEDLPFKEALNQKRRLDRVMNHVLKCFTFGKKVRRQMDDDVTVVSRVEILKRRFKRLELVRDYFSVRKMQFNKKFRFPLTELANEYNEEALKIYDELQYCQESEPDEDTKVERKIDKLQRAQSPDININQDIKSILRERHFSLEFKNQSRNQFIQQNSSSTRNLNTKSRLDFLEESVKDQEYVSSESTFHSLSNYSRDSLYSSPRQMIEAEDMMFNKVLPFDFITQRKAKKFYKEDLCDITKLLQNKDKALQELKLLQQKKNNQDQDQSKAANKLREVSLSSDDIPDLPETNKQFKENNKIIARKKQRKIRDKKLVIKGELSSSSDDERFLKYKFAEKVQNTQIRDYNNDLKSMFFMRSQAKNHKVKKEVQMKIAEFKNSLNNEQIDLLQNRQFVIVDIKSLNNNRVNSFIPKNQERIKQQIEMKQEIQKEEDDKQQKQFKLAQTTKQQILREKVNFISRNNSLQQIQSERPLIREAASQLIDNQSLKSVGDSNAPQSQFELRKNNTIQTQMSKRYENLKNYFSNPYEQEKTVQISGFSSTISSTSNLRSLPMSAQSLRNPEKNDTTNQNLNINSDQKIKIYKDLNTDAPYGLQTFTSSYLNTQNSNNASKIILNRTSRTILQQRHPQQSIYNQQYQNILFINQQDNNNLETRNLNNFSNTTINFNSNAQLNTHVDGETDYADKNKTLENKKQINQDHNDKETEEDLDPQEMTFSQNLMKKLNLQSIQSALKESPYTGLEKDLQKLIPQSQRLRSATHHYNHSQGLHSKKESSDKSKYKGYLAEKLRRKSVLNCELFKNREINYKTRVHQMVDKFNRVIGTQMHKTKLEI